MAPVAAGTRPTLGVFIQIPGLFISTEPGYTDDIYSHVLA